jgi:hypothetical protein
VALSHTCYPCFHLSSSFGVSINFSMSTASPFPFSYFPIGACEVAFQIFQYLQLFNDDYPYDVKLLCNILRFLPECALGIYVEISMPGIVCTAWQHPADVQFGIRPKAFKYDRGMLCLSLWVNPGYLLERMQQVSYNISYSGCE